MHLHKSTQRENMQDRKRSKKWNTGSRYSSSNGNSSLSVNEVRKIKKYIFDEIVENPSHSKTSIIKKAARLFGLKATRIRNWVNPRPTAYKYTVVDFRECEFYKQWNNCFCRNCYGGPGFRLLNIHRLKPGDIFKVHDGFQMLVRASESMVFGVSSQGFLSSFLKDEVEFIERPNLDLRYRFTDLYKEITGVNPSVVSNDIQRQIKEGSKLGEKEIQDMYSAQNQECYHCGIPLTQTTKTIDRLNPGMNGGKYEKGNCVISCKKCNSKRNHKKNLQLTGKKQAE